MGEELRLKVILDDSDYSDLSEVRWFKGNQLITQDHRTKACNALYVLQVSLRFSSMKNQKNLNKKNTKKVANIFF